MALQTVNLHEEEPAEPASADLTTLVQDKDWSQTPLGPLSQWPQSLRTVVNILLTSRYAMWMGWGPELTFLYNDAYRPTLGLKHPWALGARADKVWAEIWRDIGPRIQTVLSTGKATWDEALFLILERSGFPEETYHTFSYSPLADDAGKLNGMFCVVTEETERVINERRLDTLRELASGLATANVHADLRHAVEQHLSGNARDLPFTLTYLYEPTGEARLAFVSGITPGHPGAPMTIGEGANTPWPAADILARPAATVVPWNNSATLPAGAWDKPCEQVAIIPIRHQAHDRPVGFFAAGINPYRHYDADYAGFVELVAGQIAAGIASVRAYEEERRRAQALAELDRAKTTFFSNVSHEFRTPLTLILGQVEELLSQPVEDLHRRLEVVQRNGLRLQRLVNTLLDFSRIEAGRVDVSREPTDLATFTAELASGFRSAMERAGLEFTLECAPLSRAVNVDREMWEKVVLNLLSNAFKFTLEGSVTVRLVERGDRVELSVSDTGVGIPEKDLYHLFERFYRVEGRSGRTHEGTGIGLALVQELIRLHGGNVTISSTEGAGSTFTVTLPFGDESPVVLPAGPSATLAADAYIDEAMRWLPDAAHPASAGPSPGADQKGVVLVADDNADMREYVARLLSTRYQVVTAANGHEALEAAHSLLPDLVLADVMMPVLDGFGLLRALRSSDRTKTIPIVLVSARAGEESRVEGLDAGADDYLIKPFTARELLSCVESHISLARMRRAAEQSRHLSEMRLGLALESGHMLAWEWDSRTGLMSGIGDQQSLFGIVVRTPADAYALVYEEDLPAHLAKVLKVRLHGGAWQSEFRIRRADTGELAWLEDRGVAIKDDDGGVERIVGVTVDVTDRRNAEEELRHKNDELTRANQELEEFAYVASHDLQEPLRMVNIYAQLLIRQTGREKDEEAQIYAGFVEQGVMQMDALIRDLLSYARIVHPEQEAPHAADLNQSLEQALAVIRVGIEEAGASIVRGPLPTVLGDERQLALVFQNLLSNAVKYRRAGAPLRVEIHAERREQRNGEWVISVRDNGIGFDPHHAARIFGLFKRLHKDAYPGTGLGLAIARRIVERYSGTIWAESEGEGRGATVCFTLREAY